jgi:hypothetical protein
MMMMIETHILIIACAAACVPVSSGEHAPDPDMASPSTASLGSKLQQIILSYMLITIVLMMNDE